MAGEQEIIYQGINGSVRLLPEKKVTLRIYVGPWVLEQSHEVSGPVPREGDEIKRYFLSFS